MFNYTCSTSKSVCASNEVAAPDPLALVPVQAPSSSEPNKPKKGAGTRKMKVKEIIETKKPKKGHHQRQRRRKAMKEMWQRRRERKEVQHRHLPLQTSARKDYPTELLLVSTWKELKESMKEMWQRRRERKEV
jgi:hypothetical protein